MIDLDRPLSWAQRTQNFQDTVLMSLASKSRSTSNRVSRAHLCRGHAVGPALSTNTSQSTSPCSATFLLPQPFVTSFFIQPNGACYTEREPV